MAKDSWSPRVQAWLARANRGPRSFSEQPLLRAFEERLLAEATGSPDPSQPDFHQAEYLVFGGEPSSLRIGEHGAAGEFSRVAGGPTLAAPKVPSAAGKKVKPQRWPIFATDASGLYALASDGSVIEQSRRPRKTGNIVFAQSLAQWLERAVLREPERYAEIRWSAPDTQKPGSPFAASGELPHPLASGGGPGGEDWWDEPHFTARRAEGIVSVWFADSESADKFFATRRGADGTLWTANRYRIPEPGQARAEKPAGRAPPLREQLDKLLSQEIVRELRARGATFEPKGVAKRTPPLEMLLAKEKLELHPAAIEVDERFAGLALPDEDGYLAIGIWEMLASGGEPWPQKGAPIIRGEQAVPFGVFDFGTRQSLWLDASGSVHSYSDELGLRKLASSVEKMFEQLLFPQPGKALTATRPLEVKET